MPVMNLSSSHQWLYLFNLQNQNTYLYQQSPYPILVAPSSKAFVDLAKTHELVDWTRAKEDLPMIAQAFTFKTTSVFELWLVHNYPLFVTVCKQKEYVQGRDPAIWDDNMFRHFYNLGQKCIITE